MIREANKTDCINLSALSFAVWFDTYCGDGIRTESSAHALSAFSAEAFKKILSQPHHKLIVFVDGVYLRGYALVNLSSYFKSPHNGFEIEKLYVQPQFQGQGIGQQLLSDVMARYGDKFWLYTWIWNKSVGFYKKFGLKEIGRYNFKLGEDTIENFVLAYDGT